MSNTSIEWTNATWNPLAGCKIISPGCTNCYAMTMARRLELMGIKKYEGLTRKSGKRVVWTGDIREDPASLDIPHKWKKPRQIFVNSMSDLFHDSVSEEYILSIWQVMYETPRHTYQILTKRPDRMRDVLTRNNVDPLENVWLGTSVENKDASGRIEELSLIPSALRFISFEPLLGSVGSIDLSNIHWAIVGGESGSSARPIQEEWIDEIHTQCMSSETSFFFKQWGTWGEDGIKRSKKANGRLYKGQVWDEMPKG